VKVGPPPLTATSAEATIEVDDVADVFMRLSRAFSSVGEDDDEDDHALLNMLNSKCTPPERLSSGTAAIDVNNVADVFVRVSKVFSTFDEDEDEDDNVLAKPLGSTSGEAASEIDQVTDVFVRMSRVFSSVDEEEAEDDHEIFSLWNPKPTEAISGEAVCEVDDVADVFMRLSRAFSSVDQDEDDQCGQDVFSASKPMCSTSGEAASEVDNVADVFMRLSRAFSSADEDDVGDECNLGSPCKADVTTSLYDSTSGKASSDVEHVADVVRHLSEVFSSDEEEPHDFLVMAQKAKCTASSDGSTYGGETSDFEEETTSVETSDCEMETYAQTLAA